MKNNLKIVSLLLFPISLIISFLCSKYPQLVENLYSTTTNKTIIEIISNVTSIVPFSIYELTVYILVFSVLCFILFTAYSIVKRKNNIIIFLKKSILNILAITSIAYFLFVILWGINYNRVPLKDTLISRYNKSSEATISKIEYTNDDLENLYSYLIECANKTRDLVVENNFGIMKSNSNIKGIIDRAQYGYDNILSIVPSVSGNYGKPKPVISSQIMCYTGITGIYFPWTGEANINIAIPHIYIPSTTTHEMAHQRGFASEDEANFIAYLACINHPDDDFKYSGYILALNHTASALKKSNLSAYEKLSKDINSNVLRDLRYNNEFWIKYEGKIDDISNNFNDAYLKSNGVKEGTKSYGKMVDLLLTYYTLYPFL